MRGGGFTDRWARTTIKQLARRGVDFADGLSDHAISEIGDCFGAPVPAELACFLCTGLPVGSSWARWQDGPESVLEWTRRWIDRAFAFDIEQNAYWHPLLGARPESTDDAVEQALAFLRTAPPLLPIYGHRFITTSTNDQPQPVLSVYQAVDSIFYGYDLADYFTREFAIAPRRWAASQPPAVPTWGRLLDLLGTETS